MTTVTPTSSLVHPQHESFHRAPSRADSGSYDAFALDATQAVKGSVRISEEARALATAAGLTEVLARAQKVMAYTHPAATPAAVAPSTAGAPADDSASHFGSERQAQEQRLRAIALMRLLEQTGGGSPQLLRAAEKGVDASRAALAEKSYRAMQGLDTPQQAALARARQLGLHVSVLA